MKAISEEFQNEYSQIVDFNRYKGLLYISEGVVLYQDRVVMPSSLRRKVLENLHAAHQGVSSMQVRAQSIVFWPGMTVDIQETRSKCGECNRNAPSQAPLPSEPAVPPSTPFEQVFSDFFEFGGHHYLIIGDRLSGWAEVYSTPSGSAWSGARGLVACLRSFMATFGVPEELSSDGGPEFTASLTKEFLKNWGIKPRISSAYNPQSNGRAEVAVKAAKRLLRTNINRNGSLDNDKFLRAILQLRNTPDPDCDLSPAQILFGRPIKDSLGFVNRLEKFTNPNVRPMWREAWQAKEEALRTRFTRSSENLNEHAKPLPPLKVGDKCFVQNQTGKDPSKWFRTGSVVETGDHDQYFVRIDGSGRVTKRNRRFLRAFKPASASINFGHVGRIGDNDPPRQNDTTKGDSIPHSSTTVSDPPLHIIPPNTPARSTPMPTINSPQELPPEDTTVPFEELETAAPPSNDQSVSTNKLPVMIKRLLPFNASGKLEDATVVGEGRRTRRRVVES